MQKSQHLKNQELCIHRTQRNWTWCARNLLTILALVVLGRCIWSLNKRENILSHNE